MISIRNLTVSFGENRVIDNFSMEIGKGITALLGPSGCGKTTLLGAAAGLIRYDGEISKSGKCSMVFNEPRLLPWYSSLRNVKAVTRGMIDDEALRLLRVCEADSFADKLPEQLSAGMAQRVSIARALAYKADILLMDEPFKAVDAELKSRLIKSVIGEFKGSTVVFVTHDAAEAELIADRIVTLKAEPLRIVEDIIKSDMN